MIDGMRFGLQDCYYNTSEHVMFGLVLACHPCYIERLLSFSPIQVLCTFRDLGGIVLGHMYRLRWCSFAFELNAAHSGIQTYVCCVHCKGLVWHILCH